MKKKFLIEGMTCTACQGHVFNAVNNLKDVSNVNVNLREIDFKILYKLEDRPQNEGEDQDQPFDEIEE